ncbi:MAG: hypothetical protein K6T83_03910, partial [Alicyclobacillus sp.]|nr:hypothetical protein [Alicyclobacillus sp.]
VQRVLPLTTTDATEMVARHAWLIAQRTDNPFNDAQVNSAQPWTSSPNHWQPDELNEVRDVLLRISQCVEDVPEVTRLSITLMRGDGHLGLTAAHIETEVDEDS